MNEMMMKQQLPTVTAKSLFLEVNLCDLTPLKFKSKFKSKVFKDRVFVVI